MRHSPTIPAALWWTTPVLYLYVALHLLTTHSLHPVYLGRYSTGLLLLNAWNLLLYGWAWYSWRSDSHSMRQAVTVAFAVSSLGALANQGMHGVLFISLVLPLIRLSAGVSLIASELIQRREGLRTRGAYVALASLLAVLSIADYAILAVLHWRDDEAQLLLRGSIESRLRRPVDLSRLEQGSIVAVGDSFVWGQGVENEETFSSRLEALFEQSDPPRQVYNLGQIGTGPATYLMTIERILPGTGISRFAIGFYANDIEPRPQWQDNVRDRTKNLGMSAPSLRVVTDMVASAFSADVDAWLEARVADYDPSLPGFDRRWDGLVAEIGRICQAATGRSEERPLLIIFPLMMDFRNYPLTEMHERLASEGERAGCASLDLLPHFRRAIPNGRDHWVSEIDPHMDPEAHAITARAVFEWLGDEPRGDRTPLR